MGGCGCLAFALCRQFFPAARFHQCVRLSKFDVDREITFIPPDEPFQLMTPESESCLLLACYCAVTLDHSCKVFDSCLIWWYLLQSLKELEKGSLRALKIPTVHKVSHHWEHRESLQAAAECEGTIWIHMAPWEISISQILTASQPHSDFPRCSVVAGWSSACRSPPCVELRPYRNPMEQLWSMMWYFDVFCKWTSLWPGSWARWNLWEQFGWLFYIILTYFDDGRQIPTLKMTSIWWKPSVFVGTTATLKPQMPRISDPAHDWGVMMRTSCCTDPHSQQFIPKISKNHRFQDAAWCLVYTSSLSDGLQMDFRWVSRWSPRSGLTFLVRKTRPRLTSQTPRISDDVMMGVLAHGNHKLGRFKIFSKII